MNLVSYIDNQRLWSKRTFGDGKRKLGICEHIRSELDEILSAETSEDELKEWIDVIILALDGAWRSGFDAQIILDELGRKQMVNFRREWGTSISEDMPVFHKKDTE